MRNRVSFLAPVFFGMALCVPLHAEALDGTLQKIRDTGVISLGHRESSLPFSYFDERKQVIGYSHEIALQIVEAVKQELRLPKLGVRLVPVNPKTRMGLMQDGTIDLECGSTTNNTERQKLVAFSNTIFIYGVRFIIKSNNFFKEKMRDFSDFSGKTVVTTAGTTSEPLLIKLNQEKNLGMNVVLAKDHGEAFAAVESDRAIAFVMDEPLLYGERAKAKQPSAWVVAGTPLQREVYACMLRKNDPSFKALVDRTIARMQTSGQAEVLYRKWFMLPIPPRGLKLDYVISPENRWLFRSPNDRAFQ